jgi:tetratricopeptide (TPR) repeat protein
MLEAGIFFMRSNWLKPCSLLVLAFIFGCMVSSVEAAKLETWQKDCFDFSLKEDDAISACSTSLRGRKSSPRYLVQRGALWLSLKDYDYAASDFTRAIDQDYGGVLPYYGRAAAYIGSDQFINAMLDIQTILIRSMPDILLYKAIDQLLSWEAGRRVDVVYNDERKYPIMVPVKRSRVMILDDKIDLSEYFIGIPPFLILMTFVLLTLL